MHLETILTNFINVRFKRPAVRRYEIENLYEYEPEKPVNTKSEERRTLLGKEKDKKPLFGSIFQKFFKPSAKAEAKKEERAST